MMFRRFLGTMFFLRMALSHNRRPCVSRRPLKNSDELVVADYDPPTLTNMLRHVIFEQPKLPPSTNPRKNEFSPLSLNLDL